MFVNIVLIAVIILEESLHEPMYICLCNLFVNELFVKVSTLLIFAWLSSICIILIVIVLSVRLPLCGSAIEKLYCDNVSIMMLSCVEPSINNIYGVIMAAIGNRVNSKSVPVFVSVILSLEFLLIPPLFNPTIYGVRTEKIRNVIGNLFRKRILPGLQI
nr:PREDICTED: olfactory receptor 52K1-like [Latimeria chalumnae]|eukprot:XP_014353819.1 PREDICTED: olfactory receptor 52K1-like [Latimeria chalumnae]